MRSSWMLERNDSVEICSLTYMVQKEMLARIGRALSDALTEVMTDPVSSVISSASCFVQ